MIEWAFVGNLKVLRGPSPTPFESFPTPWSPLADSSFAPVTDPLAPLVEICSAFPTFGGSLLSFLQPLRGPSSSFVALRGFLFLPLWITLNWFQAWLWRAVLGSFWTGTAFCENATKSPPTRLRQRRVHKTWARKHARQVTWLPLAMTTLPVRTSSIMLYL